MIAKSCGMYGGLQVDVADELLKLFRILPPLPRLYDSRKQRVRDQQQLQHRIATEELAKRPTSGDSRRKILALDMDDTLVCTCPTPEEPEVRAPTRQILWAMLRLSSFGVHFPRLGSQSLGEQKGSRSSYICNMQHFISI